MQPKGSSSATLMGEYIKHTVLRGRTRGNGYKIEHKNFQLDIHYIVLNHGSGQTNWKGLPREALESPFLQVLKTALAEALSNLT